MRPSILLRPSCPPEDHPEIQRFLELIAVTVGASFVELELVTPDGQVGRYRRGEPTAEAAVHPLALRQHRGTLRLGGAGDVPGRLADLVAFSLDGILQGVRSSAQLAVLLAGMEASTSSVLMFDRDADIVYANPRADALLSQPAEGLPDSGQPGQPFPTLFARLRSAAKKLLDGQLARRAWNSLLVLTDGSVIGCEIVLLGGESGVSGVAAAALLQPLTTLPVLFLEAFCAHYGVSPREQEVIGLLLEGRGTSEIACRLSISEHTVRDHLKSLYRKTGTRSRSELISVVSTARMEPAASLDRF